MRLIFVLSLLLFACSEDASNDASNDASSKKSELTKVKTPNKLCVADVEGMVCKMGCVASIKKELRAVNGVFDVQIDFKEDEPLQEVKISYNDQNVNESKIQSTIESINNNQFSISTIRTENLID
ncbi:MAG: heavy-metal-associated domain-containing protein [Bacteroidia bacterium]|nr:heavy-metal-associated domain-containing protein [Bacteroidia bacterium]